MPTNKYILLIIGLTACHFCYSQSTVKQKLDDAMSKTSRKVVLPSGDTIVTTNKRTRVLTREDWNFFLRDTLNIDGLEDSLFYRDSKYKSLEDAASNVNNLLNEISGEQEKKEKNNSLSFRLSQKNRNQLSKEKQAEEEWDRKKDEMKLTVNDMVDLYVKYGDKPTYYINGVEVPESVAGQLRDSEILSSQFKSKNTRNPNGEIWFEVPVPVAQNIIPNNASTSRAFIDTKHKYTGNEDRTTNDPTLGEEPQNNTTPQRYYPAGQDDSDQHENSIISRRKAANRPDLMEEKQSPSRSSNNKGSRAENNRKNNKEQPQKKNNEKTVTFNLKGGKR